MLTSASDMTVNQAVLAKKMTLCNIISMELARIHSQLQGSSARPSHVLDAETCEFPSLSMLPV